MKQLLLLLLLTSWSSAQKCDTGIVLSGHILNIAGSQRAKAKVDFLHAYNSSSLQSCLDDCCAGTFGLCSIATYRNQSRDVNCLYFYCRPLSHCKFYPSISSDSFSFPATELRQDVGTDVSSQISKNVQAVIHNLKTHARSVSARKGVENIVVTRKGMMLDNVTIDAPSLKNDNTSVKPRKGVHFFEGDDTIRPTASVINPQEGVAAKGRTKIKPRKGVTDLASHIAPTRTTVELDPTGLRTSSAIDFPGRLSTASHEPEATQDNELLSMLQNVFRDEANTSESSVEVPQASARYVPHGSTPLETIHSSEVLLPSTLPVDLRASSTSNVPHPTVSELTLSRFPTETYPSSLLSTAQLPVSSDSIQSAPRSSTKFTIPASLSIRPSSATSYHRPTPSSAVISTTSSSRSDSPSSTHSSQASLAASPTTASPANDLGLPLFGAAAAVEETESERRYRSSMHLVISLVFGLIVLFAVLGAVAKRIYDVWMRRHYHRMDFLIDGLYDGYS